MGQSVAPMNLRWVVFETWNHWVCFCDRTTCTTLELWVWIIVQ